MTAPSEPALSAIIPARNAADTVGRCLDALLAEAGENVEVIVVDDCSQDATRQAASQRHRVRLFALAEHRGVAAARNHGAAAARAPILLFLDADVVVTEGTLRRVLRHFDDSTLDAVIGSYDPAPEARSLVSLFKNLAHHHFHQVSAGEATTFWGACGAVRRERFFAVGGFDAGRYELPSIEDVELGQRLRRAGARIVLDPLLQVKHLKRWTLVSLLATDVLRRAVPWTLLALERGEWPTGLNFGGRQRAAAALSPLLLMAGACSFIRPSLLPALIALFAAAFWINRDLFALFRRRGGVRLMIAGFALQQFYYLYSIFGLVAGLFLYAVGGRSARQRRREARA